MNVKTPDSSESTIEPTGASASVAACRNVSRPARIALLAFGWLNVGFGVAGAFLPLVPTTIFLLVALWCFMRCSPRLAARLYGHARFGPTLRRWHEERVIPIPAKFGIGISLSASLVAVHMLGPDLPVAKWLATAVCLAVLAFLLSRPHTSRDAAGLAVAAAD